MSFLRDWPKILARKVIMTALVGVGCLFIGVSYFFYSGDRTTLLLSATVLVFSFVRTFGLYRTISAGQYETVEGTCVAVKHRPMRKHFVIKMMDDSGIESTMYLDKQTKVKIGFRYRFYFSRVEKVSLGNEYLDASLSHGAFLGYEELGDIMEPRNKPDPPQKE